MCPAGLFAPDVRIIHVVRNPTATLRSRVIAGWANISSPKELTREATALCHDMMYNHVLLSNVFPVQHITVPYEALQNTFGETFSRIVEFIDGDRRLVKHQSVVRRAHALLQSKFASVQAKRPKVCCVNS